ncbi:MAG: 5'/3'-nucleotidase SurE [Sphaerochaetaceae bacterium]|nr:5'/3'-nucleotidase SurE [Sphaerochaetaceae bacterium]
MRILLTNDDGLNAEGLAALETWARTKGEVTVVAPKTEQSGKSHSIEIHKSFEVLKVAEGRYSVDSSPADCVRFAFSGLGRDFDLVLSGINKGFNVGTDIVYSGTDGAIFEASCLGCRALAFSTDPESFEDSKRLLDRIWAFIEAGRLFDYNDIYNINIPLKATSIRVTAQGSPYYKDRFVRTAENMYMADGYSVYSGARDLERDIDAVMHGHVSITPLCIDRTSAKAYMALKGISESI